MKKITMIILIVIVISSASFTGGMEVPKRIISLAPSTTEILFALGLGDRIIGVTSFCDYPEEAKEKQKIGGMSNPSLEAIVALKPDMVVMTTDGNPKEVEERLRSMKITTYVFRARRLHELPGGIRDLATALGVKGKVDRLAGEIEKALATRKAEGVRRQKTEDRRQTTDEKSLNPQSEIRNSKLQKVLFIVWPEPLIVAGPGTAIDDAITLLGWENAASRAATAYPRYSIEELIREAPEALFIGKGSGMDMRAVSQGILNKLSSVPAIRNGKVCFVSDNLYRLGPRVVNGIEELAECIP